MSTPYDAEWIEYDDDRRSVMEAGINQVGASIDEPAFEMMAQLEAQIRRYERVLSMTEQLLRPVLLESEEPQGTRPIEAPITDLHQLIQQLELVNDAFERMRSRIRL